MLGVLIRFVIVGGLMGVVPYAIAVGNGRGSKAAGVILLGLTILNVFFLGVV